MKKIIVLLMAITTSSCINQINKKPNFEGNWVLKTVVNDSNVDDTCPDNNPESKITLNIVSNAADHYDINGKSAVNQYFGSFDLISMDLKNGMGVIQINQVGSTKKAGPENAMRCENKFFSILNDAKNIHVNNDNLEIGQFKIGDATQKDLVKNKLIFIKIKE